MSIVPQFTQLFAKHIKLFYQTGKKLKGPSNFLMENQLIGPQELIDVKNISAYDLCMQTDMN